MKQLIWIAALLLLLSACGGKEEAPVAVDEAAATQEAAAPAEEEMATEATEDEVEDTLEVVEESAAVEEEAADEPIVLAMADDTPAPARDWQFQEGRDYTRMVPTQPTVGGADKIEVAEVFWYSCGHCFNLDPNISSWAENLDPGVRFVRIPFITNQLTAMHAQMYYTSEVLARNGMLAEQQAFHTAAFNEYQVRGNRLTNQTVIQKLFQRFGVSPEDFDKAWNSFEVNQKMRLAQDLTRRYGIMAVPTIVVNGKYVVPNSRQSLEITDELLAREGIR